MDQNGKDVMDLEGKDDLQGATGMTVITMGQIERVSEDAQDLPIPVHVVHEAGFPLSRLFCVQKKKASGVPSRLMTCTVALFLI